MVRVSTRVLQVRRDVMLPLAVGRWPMPQPGAWTFGAARVEVGARYRTAILPSHRVVAVYVIRVDEVFS